MEQIVYLSVKELKPYKGNPRKNAEAVEAVAASIKEFGFRSPIVIDKDNTVINGHTRLKVAKKLGYKEVPCIRVEDLSEEQIRKFRLIDNKTSEYASWDADLLAEELKGLDFDFDFDFSFDDDLKKRKKWEKQKVLCDLKDHLGLHRCNDTVYQSLFKTGKKGIPIEDIKVSDNVRMFAKTTAEFITSILGPNLAEADWCLVTTPRRRHREGFHFATEICRWMASELNIPYYEGALTSDNSTRLDPIFNLEIDPKEKNVIIYDDVLTTGYTLQATKNALIEAGHVTFPVISIDNH